MAVSKAINTRILCGGYRISSQTNKVTIKLDAKKTEATPFEATAQVFIVSDPEPSIDLQGYLSFVAGGAGTYEKLAMDALNTAETIAVIKSANTTFTGAPAFVLPQATAVSMNQDFPVDGVMTIGATWGGATAMRHGKSLYSGAISGTGTKPSVDFTTQGTLGGDAYLFVTAITGSATNATIKVQSSATEGGAYADEGTFTFSAIGDYTVALTGTIDRWLRIETTSMGGATAFTVDVIGTIKR